MLKARYDFACFNCNYEFEFQPSISMQNGENFGHARCPQCMTMMMLEISPDGESGVSKAVPDDMKEVFQDIEN